MRSFCYQSTRQGFTLSELLITLAILGIISVFSIPKILNEQRNQKEKALFRETIAAMTEVFNLARVEGGLTATSYSAFILDHVNAVRLCRTNSNTEGCWTHTSAWAAEIEEPGFIMHNGVTVAGIHASCCWMVAQETLVSAFIIDVNGPAAPNQEGEDQMRVVGVIGPNNWTSGVTLHRVGTVTPWSSALSQTLYEEIFSN